MRFTLTMTLLCLWAFTATAQVAMSPMKADQKQVQQWNRFAEDLYQLHLSQLKNRTIRKTSHYDGYSQLPRFYREERFYDKDSGRLLSRVAWETENPDRLHEIEVFIYDKQGRVIRDFLARYLPKFRNAPIQTLINLHAYNGDTHSFRQFDASGNRIYETCRGELSGDKIHIDLEEDQLTHTASDAGGMTNNLDYEVCFDGLPARVGKYLQPQ